MRPGLDIYYTGDILIDPLLNHINIKGKLFEPCNGSGQISKFLIHINDSSVLTNDIRGGFDATDPVKWEEIAPDWTVTNPPFNQAMKILHNAIQYSKIGVAFLLRLSFLEPTIERGEFLAKMPPNKLIVLPRYSFSGDGKTDSVTTAWMIWDKTGESFIKVIRKSKRLRTKRAIKYILP